VSAKFAGKVTLSDLDPPNGYTISGEGQGGVAGFAKGGAKVNLKDESGGTLLSYTVQAQVGGKLAQIGSRLIDATARKMAEEFFARFAAAVSAPAPAPVGAPGAEVAAPAPPESTRAAERRLPPLVWAAILAAIIVVLLYYYTRGEWFASAALDAFDPHPIAGPRKVEFLGLVGAAYVDVTPDRAQHSSAGIEQISNFRVARKLVGLNLVKRDTAPAEPRLCDVARHLRSLPRLEVAACMRWG